MKKPTPYLNFFLKIILPSFVAIILYVFLIFSFLIPEYEKAILDRKREMIKELTNSATSILEEYYKEEKAGVISTKEAQNSAISRIKGLRYGEENKDYFWITDMHPIMIMHPYRSDLDSTDLSDFTDPAGKKLFLEFINAVKPEGEGYVDYMWQWKDDSAIIVPKLSFVKHFKPWNWVIGTGIYIEDVKEEISKMESRLINISSGIIVTIFILLLIITLQSLRIEKRRNLAESELKKSHEKYKTVVEDLNDGIIMLLNGHIIYSNKVIQDLLGYSNEELNNKYIINLLTEEDRNNPEGIRFFKELNKTSVNQLNYEVELLRKNDEPLKIDMNISKTKVLNENGYLLKLRSLSDKRVKFNEEKDTFKSLTDNINIGVFRAQMNKNGKFLDANFATLEILGFENKEELYNTEIFSLFHDKNDRNEFIRNLVEIGFVKNKVIKLNRSDGKITSIAVSAAVVDDEEGNPSFCDGIIEDISEQKKIEEKKEQLMIELQTSLLFYNQPIVNFLKPLYICNMNTKIGETAKLMTKKDTNAILITDDSDNQLGIVTDHDMRERVLSRNLSYDEPIFKIMSSPVLYISDRSLLFEALTEMNEKQISNLAIKNTEGKIISIINYNELSNVQQYSPAFHIKLLKNCEDIEEIKKLQLRVPQMIKSIIETGGDSSNITRLLTTISDIITEKLLDIGIEKIGKPPIAFAFVVMGSEGRNELTLATDQDNAIIFEDINSDQDIEMIKNYFLKLGEFVCDSLNEVGYHHCKGNMMAKNPKWNQSVSTWKKYFSSWMVHFEPNDILTINTFYDLKFLYGEENLVTDLKDYINNKIMKKDTFFFNLASYALKFKPPLNIFGSIVTSGKGENDFFNIKESIIPLTIFARYKALKNNINETSTYYRFKSLSDKNIITASEFNKAVQAYDYLMLMRLKNQTAQIADNKEPNNLINPKKLNDLEIGMLKKIFSEINSFQNKMNQEFRGMLY
ncbi:MAG: DUF294 nucleotidyltransferase-like domain-containing protein [Bacteroidota bacterium]